MLGRFVHIKSYNYFKSEITTLGVMLDNETIIIKGLKDIISIDYLAVLFLLLF